VALLSIWGSRASLAIGVIATLLTMIVGSGIGLIAGHYQGLTSRLLMTLTDWFITLPSLPLAISLAAILGQGSTSITIAIAATSWPATARLVRAQTLSVEARPFIERARALGAGNVQIIVRQVLPNVMPLVLVSSTLTIAGAILSETTLSFLGLGNPSDVTWGTMINQAFTSGAITRGAWWYLLPPGIAIVLVVLGFTMTGRAVEHILNPRMVGARS
jgi:peptide/nickel transport system permease protein